GSRPTVWPPYSFISDLRQRIPHKQPFDWNRRLNSLDASGAACEAGHVGPLTRKPGGGCFLIATQQKRGPSLPKCDNYRAIPVTPRAECRALQYPKKLNRDCTEAPLQLPAESPRASPPRI